MAAITGAVIAAGTAAYAANQQKKAAQGAANAQAAGQQASIDEQRRQFDVSRQDQMPWMQAGQNALNLQQQFLAGDTSGFDQSADYKFAVDQGFAGLDRGAASQGALGPGGFSGGIDADRIALGQGLATQYSNNYYNKLSGLSGTGQSSAANLGSLGANMASNVGNSLTNIGNARASAYQQRGDTNSQLAGALGGLANNYFQSQAVSSAPISQPSVGTSSWSQQNFQQPTFYGNNLSNFANWNG